MSSSSSSSSTNPFAPQPVAISATTAQLINIKSHVYVILDLGGDNFRTWRTFFLIAFRKFGLMDHVDGTVDARLQFDDTEWIQIDICIVSWLYSTLSDELLSAVIQPNDDAYTVWSTIGSQFLDNVIQRTAQARQRLHALSQGDLSVTDYCANIKRVADVLRDLGSPLTDQELVITLLSGLSDKLAHCAPTISVSRMPFLQARSFLHQEEAWIADRAQKTASTALLSTARSTTPTGAPTNAPVGITNNSTPYSSGGSNGGSARPRKRKKQSGHTGGASSASPTAAAPTPTHGGAVTSWVNPWTGVVQAWPLGQLPPGAPGAGVLGTRPGSAPP